jgi:hypothetical protein
VLDAADIPLPSLASGGVASDGSGFLVVGSPSGSTSTISGYRISAAGVVIDATPFTISLTDGSRANPRVTFDGSNYLAVWRDSRSGSYRPYAARVSSAGAVMDAEGFALAEATVSGAQDSPELASDGQGNSLAVWIDSKSYSLAGTRITGNSVVDPAGIVIQARPSTLELISAPRVAFDGTNFVVGFVHEKSDSNYHTISYTLKTARVSPQGAVLAGLQIATHPSEDLPAQVASDRAGGTLLAYQLPDTTWGFPVPRARARIFYENPPTGACRLPADCATGFCVDGVCCDSSCGGGVTTDCTACSKAAGASSDGTCGFVVDGYGCSDSNACTVNDTCTQGICAGVLWTAVPGRTCSVSADAGRPDGPSDTARVDAGIRLDGAGPNPDLRPDGPTTAIDTRIDMVRTTDAITLPLDSAPVGDAALAIPDALSADTQAVSSDAVSSTVDAGVSAPVDAQVAKKSPSGCSCNQGHVPTGVPWPLTIVLPLIALARSRRRR